MIDISPTGRRRVLVAMLAVCALVSGCAEEANDAESTPNEVTPSAAPATSAPTTIPVASTTLPMVSAQTLIINDPLTGGSYMEWAAGALDRMSQAGQLSVSAGTKLQASDFAGAAADALSAGLLYQELAAESRAMSDNSAFAMLETAGFQTCADAHMETAEVLSDIAAGEAGTDALAAPKVGINECTRVIQEATAAMPAP